MPNHTAQGSHERDPLIAGRPRSRPPTVRASLHRASKSFSNLLSFHDNDTESVVSNLSQGYDDDLKAELTAEGSGTRTWARNFESIDWLNDNVKEDVRKRKLRAMPGLRGRLANAQDRLSGWVVVTLVGFITACIAYCIITSERWLFDVKEGYCTTNWRRTRGTCCNPHAPQTPDKALSSLFVSHHLTGWSAHETVACPDWRTWSEIFAGSKAGQGDSYWIDYAAVVVLAVIFATVSSLMTVYLTSSESVNSAKDRLHSLESEPSTPSSSQQNFPAKSVEDEKATRPPRAVMYYAGGSGIPEVKSVLGGFVIRGYLGAWTLGVKGVGLAFSVASGLSLGKEGPFVHLACCVANLTTRFFSKYDMNEAKRREILSAACAAGVAVSFGAPVGGVLFSLEETSYYFPPKTIIRSFFCAIIAALTLKAFDPFGNGQIVLFQVTYDRDTNSLELLGFIFLGIFGGIYGALFCKGNLAWASQVRAKTWMKRHPVWEVVMIVLITVMVSFFNPYTKMGGTELVAEMFTECRPGSSNESKDLCINSSKLLWPLLRSLLTAMCLKALLTVVTFGIKLPAGIFIPTLAVGALFGRVVGLLVELMYEKHSNWAVFAHCSAHANPDLLFGERCIIPGIWAMVGAAATLAGVTRTTVSLAVIVFELTSTLNYVVPVMLSVLVAKTVADAIEANSIYDLVLTFSRLPYLDSKAEVVHCARPGDVMDRNAPAIHLDDDNTLASLKQKLIETENSAQAQGFPVLRSIHGTNSSRLVGYLGLKELAFSLAKNRNDPTTPVTFHLGLGEDGPLTASSCDFGHLVDVSPVVVTLRSPMEVLQELMVKLGVKQLIVLDEQYSYAGTISKEAWMGYLQYAEKNHLKHGHAGYDRESHVA